MVEENFAEHPHWPLLVAAYRQFRAGTPRAALDQLEDPASDLSREWDREHDSYVARKLLDYVEPEFRPATWQAFRRLVLDGAAPQAVAEELSLSVNAVLIAKSRVLRRLRQEALGLID